jgi:UDP-N-acetylglucosamine 2-epimerase (non-hydrolysing)
MKIICVVGARPNFIKAAPIVEALRKWPNAQVRLIHTGQHHDQGMSQVFFDELGLPAPDVDLQVGSGSHGEQTGLIMIRLEAVLQEERPDLVIVFGDVNSTVAASLCAAKLGIRVAHVEAGLRSFDRSMPEELNRVVTDHLSDYLFVTERSGCENLLREGIAQDRIFLVGNVMVDTLLKHREHARSCAIREKLNLTTGSYGVLTLHRPSNVDDQKILESLLDTINEIAKELPIVFPCHPRTYQCLDQSKYKYLQNVSPSVNLMRGMIVIEPLGYLEFLSLMSEARLILTDSGGIQEETTVLGIPCLTLRDNTERPVTIEQGTNVLVGNSPYRILTALSKVLKGACPKGKVPDLWDGKAAQRIADILQKKMAS